MRIVWTESVSNDDVLREMKIKRTHILSIRMKQLICLGQIIKKEGLANLTLTGHIEGKRDG